ncbi:UDP-N-acetylglucosamine 1-carboxyvinyltransferase [Fulvivirga maritima]|uniref:UDP-N-acetylglucosamine 1-carboxyvinyltransferase n=1 Tax=Fulvivirga maritima TaxID=2904247 RepID=UPI001F4284E9|nr:UDP-N-acetylglucosamine 1-carboxyvinyltransferase [Fulvivirga maritima]UII27952.1 UDP-N-acetylglucosamine 1-carboxyvinyltransferase [Fulvivirga maritima]
MENFKYHIKPDRLVGKVKLSGAKNSALRLLAASMLTNESINLTDYPADLLDVKVHEEMLMNLGKTVHHHKKDEVIISESSDLITTLSWEGRSIRNTLLILGALLTRYGKGAVPLPGGCKLGERKYDLHEMIFREMGAEVWMDGDYLHAESKGRLQGCEIRLPIRSTGATENAIICGCLATGVTRVWNPHIRPEIMDLIQMLNKMGASITVYGQEHIRIEGKESLSGTNHNVILDNMEALTWLIGSVMTNGDVEIDGFPFKDLEVPLIFLRESGARFFRSDDAIIIRGGKCFPLEISTGPYPGINSDMQPIMAAYASQASGDSKIIDLRFPGRYQYAEEMEKVGFKSSVEGNLLNINGPCKIIGGSARAVDLRAGAALALLGLVSQEGIVIEDAWQIDRGYNNFVEKFRNLGGRIERVN